MSRQVHDLEDQLERAVKKQSQAQDNIDELKDEYSKWYSYRYVPTYTANIITYIRTAYIRKSVKVAECKIHCVADCD